MFMSMNRGDACSTYTSTKEDKHNGPLWPNKCTTTKLSNTNLNF